MTTQSPKLALSCPDFTKLLSEIEEKPEEFSPNKKVLREKCAKILWSNIGRIPSAAVCFDVDSTVTQDEMIDQFAAFLGKNIEHITRQAMDGNLPFREALSARMALLSPSKSEYEQFTREYEPLFTPKVVELVSELQNRGVPVYLVSGGFREIVQQQIAPKLDIPPMQTFFNVLKFDGHGKFTGIDRSQLTSQSGPEPVVGKAGVCALLKSRFGYKPLVMIGDGSTDLDACPPADFFIGFGGNQIREKVRSASDWFIVDFGVLLNALNEGNFVAGPDKKCQSMSRLNKKNRKKQNTMSISHFIHR